MSWHYMSDANKLKEDVLLEASSQKKKMFRTLL